MGSGRRPLFEDCELEQRVEQQRRRLRSSPRQRLRRRGNARGGPCAACDRGAADHAVARPGQPVPRPHPVAGPGPDRWPGRGPNLDAVFPPPSSTRSAPTSPATLPARSTSAQSPPRSARTAAHSHAASISPPPSIHRAASPSRTPSQPATPWPAAPHSSKSASGTSTITSVEA